MNRYSTLSTVLLAGCLTFGGGLTGRSTAQERAPQVSPTSLVSPPLTHTFSPVDPRWVVQENYLKPSPDGIPNAYATPKSEDEKKTLYREVRYFEPGHEPHPQTFLEWAQEYESGHEKRNDFVKLLTYRSNGTLLSQTDRDAKNREQWTGGYDSRGALASLTYEQDSRLLAGHSVSPDGRVQSRFTGGEGHFTVWGEDGNITRQRWIHEGSVYAERRYEHGHPLQTTLTLPTPGLPIPQADHLTLSTDTEDVQSNGVSGHKRTGKQGLTFLTPKFPLLGNTGPGRQPSPQELARQAARAGKRYDFLRHEFLERYAAFLQSIGQSFAALGLEGFSPAPSLPLSVDQANLNLHQVWGDLTDDPAEDRLQWPLVANALAQGATDFTLKTPVRGDTPLHVAAEFNDAASVQLLLKAGVGVDIRSGEGATPLFRAAMCNADRVVPILLEAGAQVNAVRNNRSSVGWTPLHVAAYDNAAQVVPLLLAAGADVNALTPDTKWTPLHAAALNRADSVVELLITAGADLNAQSINGSTPLDCATEMRADKVEVILRAHGARGNLRP